MSEIQSGDRSVRKQIAIVAGARGWGDTRESWLAIVPRKVPTVSFRTVKSIWYGEIKDPDHWAVRDIRRAAELIEARQEASALMAQYQKIIGGLRAADENIYSAEIARLERVVNELGGSARAGNSGQVR